ncbi:hypothetical protein [Asticcacaulis taihuensis]|uniref:hypothetical protein n=1 Tax=Asticcacaulis taihuensis TaxID=260084 RepID=UPI003F68F555
MPKLANLQKDLRTIVIPLVLDATKDRTVSAVMALSAEKRQIPFLPFAIRREGIMEPSWIDRSTGLKARQIRPE